jgi:hypothetical protein
MAEVAEVASRLEHTFPATLVEAAIWKVVGDSAAQGHLLVDLEQFTLDRTLPLALLPPVVNDPKGKQVLPSKVSTCPQGWAGTLHTPENMALEAVSNTQQVYMHGGVYRHVLLPVTSMSDRIIGWQRKRCQAFTWKRLTSRFGITQRFLSWTLRLFHRSCACGGKKNPR